MRATTEDRHLTVKDLAGRYGVSVWTIYGWNKTGTGPRYLKPGGSLCRYRLADVLAWEKSRIAERGRVA